MRSLAAHLREADAHDRLPFHPSCPICRQTRLTGRLPTDNLLPPRTRAMLAASMLAVSSAAPAPAAFAAEQDQQKDGTAAVTQSTTDSADSPDFDPGGEATDLPKAAPLAPQTQAPAEAGNDDTAPVEQTPAVNLDDPVVDSGDGSAATATTPATSTQPAPAPAESTPSQTTAATPTPTPPKGSLDPTPLPGPTPEATTPSSVGTPATRAPRAVRRAPHSSRAGYRQHQTTTTAPSSTTETVSPTVAPQPAAATARSTAAAAPAVVAVGGGHAKPGDHTHSVLPGESLWTIATDLLGNDETTASVAREVHRLWQLNRDRIGTGDADLLMIGTRLELR